MISAREEEQIWTHAVDFLKRGRPGDLDHTRSVVANGKILLAKEGGNPRVVIPTLILHDIGWGRVDFSDFIAAPAEAKRNVESVHLHMRYGAQLAADILNNLGWDEETIRKIISIIAVHDIPEKVLALNDLDATLVFEADWLDKFVPERTNRYFDLVPDRAELKEIKEYFKANRSRWFRTRTSRELLNRIISRRKEA